MAQAAASAAIAEAAAAAEAVSDIPGANAEWAAVAEFMSNAEQDVKEGSMGDWLANDMQRGRLVDQLCSSWILAATTAQQKQKVKAFHIAFLAACQKTC